MPGSRSPEVRQRMAARAVHADELASKVGELRLAGLTFRHIGESLGCSTSSAAEGWKRFRRSLVRGSIEQERDVLLGRCEKLLRQLASKLVTGDVQAVRAATEILRLMSDVGGLARPVEGAVDLNARAPFTKIEFVTMPIPERPDALEDAKPFQAMPDRGVGLLKAAEPVEVGS